MERADRLSVSAIKLLPSLAPHADQAHVVQHAEMLGHINTRINEANKAIHEFGKALPIPGAKPGAAAANAAAEHEHTEALKIDLETYNNNLDQMKTFAEAGVATGDGAGGSGMVPVPDQLDSGATSADRRSWSASA